MAELTDDQKQAALDAEKPKRRLPPRREPGKKYAKPRRRFRVSDVNLGDGKLLTVTMTVSREGIEIRRVGSRRAWFLNLHDAAEAVARRSQLLMVSRG